MNRCFESLNIDILSFENLDCLRCVEHCSYSYGTHIREIGWRKRVSCLRVGRRKLSVSSPENNKMFRLDFQNVSSQDERF